MQFVISSLAFIKGLHETTNVNMKVGFAFSWSLTLSEWMGFLNVTNKDIALYKDIAILISTIVGIVYTTYLIRLASKKLKEDKEIKR